MRFLIYDTETTDLPGEEARIVQFACHVMILDPENPSSHFCASEFSTLVRTGVPSKERAFETHKISLEMGEHGVPEKAIAAYFARQVELADYVVAHNLSFDDDFMRRACLRNGINIPDHKKVCTMKKTSPILKIPATARMKQFGRAGQFKSPSLEEAHIFFFGYGIPDAHDALVDVRACKKILVKLIESQFFIPSKS